MSNLRKERGESERVLTPSLDLLHLTLTVMTLDNTRHLRTLRRLPQWTCLSWTHLHDWDKLQTIPTTSAAKNRDDGAVV